MEQTVKEIAIDEISLDSMILVWGRKVGDRVIAETIMYMAPMMIAVPAMPAAPANP